MEASLSYSDVVTKTLTEIDYYVKKADSDGVDTRTVVHTSSDGGTNLTALTEKLLKSREESIRLPKWNVPIFDGDVLQFRSWWDQFNCAVHSNKKLSDIDKFTYLKSYVTGTAANLLSGLTSTINNYKKAIELMTERFGNSQTLISANMRVLSRIPRIESMSNIPQLRSVYDSLETSIRNLKDLGVETTTYGSLLVTNIFERIPEELQVIISRYLLLSRGDLCYVF